MVKFLRQLDNPLTISRLERKKSCFIFATDLKQIINKWEKNFYYRL